MNAFQLLYSSLIIFIFIFLIFGLIRKNLLRVNYSILWIAVSLFLILMLVKYDWVIKIESVLNLGNPKNFFFFITIFFLLAICIQYSIVISGLVLKVKNLSQKMALVEVSLEKKIQKNE